MASTMAMVSTGRDVRSRADSVLSTTSYFGKDWESEYAASTCVPITSRSSSFDGASAYAVSVQNSWTSESLGAVNGPNASGSSDWPLDILPGDVLCVRTSAQGVGNVGAVGGAFGHVMLLLSAPRLLQEGSEEVNELLEVLPQPHSDIWPLLRARCLECTRADSGLHESDIFFHLKEDGEVRMIGELNDDHEFSSYLDNETELWMSPWQLRRGLNIDAMLEVVEDMQAHSKDWSYFTAVRAFMSTANISHRYPSAALLQELKECWIQHPICTTIVITFWQRYITKVAESSETASGATSNVVSEILQYMPLKADRALPQELIATMEKCGWHKLNMGCVTSI